MSQSTSLTPSHFNKKPITRAFCLGDPSCSNKHVSNSPSLFTSFSNSYSYSYQFNYLILTFISSFIIIYLCFVCLSLDCRSAALQCLCPKQVALGQNLTLSFNESRETQEV